MTTRVRRVRIGSRRNAAFDQEAAEHLLKSIAQCRESIAHLVRVQKEHEDNLEKQMLAYNEHHVAVDDWVADITEDMSRASSYIDPRKLHELLEDKEFYDSVTVVAGKAAQYLSTKQLTKIKKVTEGKSKGKKLVIKCTAK